MLPRWAACFLWTLLLGTAGLLLGAAEAQAQAPFRRAAPGATQALQPARSLARNTVTVMKAEGDSLWIGPFLNLTTDGGQTFQQADATDSLRATGDVLFSLDVEGEVLWAGLGTSTLSSTAAAAGFLVSRDGGQTFARRPDHLDTGGPEDRVLRYGRSVLEAQPVTLPQQNPPYAVDFDPTTGTVWMAGGLSGIRRSTDGGTTWQRVILPPDTLESIRPDVSYNFFVAPATTAGGFLNYVGYSVLVDETGTVWAGTVAGVNRSRPEDVFLVEDEDGNRFTERAWQRFSYESGALIANQVVVLEEQPLEDRRNPVWMAARVPGVSGTEEQQRGVAFTRDGGQTFEQTLEGILVQDFAFRGEAVYAAYEEGLLVSDDFGQNWRELHPSLPDRFVAPDLAAFSVETTPGALWVGTRDGLFKSTDEGETWQVFRADVPLAPEPPTEEAPQVTTYAYPNPFSPQDAPSGRVRIVVETEAARTVTVHLYDVGMNRMRTLSRDCPAGRCEIGWDGTDRGGLRVANGVYFYEADVGDGPVRGKILVME